MDSNQQQAELRRKTRRLRFEYTIAALIIVVLMMLLWAMFAPLLTIDLP